MSTDYVSEGDFLPFGGIWLIEKQRQLKCLVTNKTFKIGQKVKEKTGFISNYIKMSNKCFSANKRSRELENGRESEAQKVRKAHEIKRKNI